MKNTLSLFIIFIASFCLLTGCLGGTKDSENKTTAKVTDEGTPIELNMIMISMGLNLDDAQMVEDAINDYIVPLINASVSIQWIDMGDLTNQMNLKMASGEVIDILPTFAGFMPTYHAKGALLGLSDLVSNYGQGVIDAIGEEYLQVGCIDGELYGIPCIQSFARQTSFYYRKDIAQKYNINFDDVKGLDDLTDILAALHEKAPDLTLIVSNNPTESMLKSFAWDSLGDSYGVLMNPSKSTVVENLFATKEYEKYITTMHQWYTAGYVQTDATTTSDNMSVLLGAGDAFAAIYRSFPGEVEKESMKCGYELGEIVLSQPLSTTTDVANTVITISTTSRYPQKAMEFINLLYTDANLTNLLYYGIEGVHYQKIGESRVDYPEGQDMSTCRYVNKFAVGNTLLAYSEASVPEQLNEIMEDYNHSAEKSLALGFAYDSTSVADELAAIDTVCAKYRRGLECGSLNPKTELPKFLKELENAGIQTVIEVKQEQLDAWLAME